MINRRAFFASLLASACVSATATHRTDDGAQGEASLDGPDGICGPRPLPTEVHGVRRCVVDLNGVWQFSRSGTGTDNPGDLDELPWIEVQMPGELAMQGVSVERDVKYLLRRTFVIPRDMARHTIVIRFDGVYSHARVWVNGHYVREHQGGFTSWDCEITPYVSARWQVDLVVMLVDRSDDPSAASEYAKHSIAGILRDVSLVALPVQHVQELCISPSLDDQYRTGLLDLKVHLSVADEAAEATVAVSLRDPMGALVSFDAGQPVRTGRILKFAQIRIPNVYRWDSEHPNLYELIVELRSGTDSETIRRMIGFRRIERIENRLLVNGEPVVLRGVCRHDMDPIRGRSPSLKNDEGDPALLKQANINFVRTSHYPPTESFLAACDRLGMYVEEETAVAFADSGASDPKLTERFVTQFGEMLRRDHWHPSVILWSLGNESQWGTNFLSELEFAREADSSRPIIFSWSDTTGDARDALDIYSRHYPEFNGDLGSSDFPILHDEMAHVACYNVDDLRRDPGVRNFWGRSIALFGRKLLETPGCLGGAIWAGIDEVFLLPDRVVGWGPWGILDVWRRPKPEFWLTRKAFSPIRLEDGILPLVQNGEEPVITIGNGYNHTNLKDLEIEWAAGDRRGVIQGPDIEPHRVSQVRIPVRGLVAGNVLKLRFRSRDGVEVDRFELPVGERVIPKFSSQAGDVSLESAPDVFILSGPGFLLTVDRTTGQIKDCAINERSVISGGPSLNIGQGRPDKWVLGKIDARKLARSIVVEVSGESVHATKRIRLRFELEVFGDGRMDLRYYLDGTHEVDQLGMSFVLPASIDRLVWHREALWSVYPDDHIGRPTGTAFRRSKRVSGRRSRTAPDWPWGEDMHEPFFDGYQIAAGKATNDFRSLKENVFWAGCFQGPAAEHLRVESQGDIAVRASPQLSGEVDLNIYNFWRYPELKWGNYVGPAPLTVFVEGSRPTPPPEYKISLRLADIVPSSERSHAGDG